MDTHLQAIIAMRHLASNARNRVKINEMGGVTPLLALAESNNPEVQRRLLLVLEIYL